MAKIKYNDYPIQECADAVEPLIAKGATIYQKWTCDNCGRRIVGNDPNTFTRKGHCEHCGHITDIDKKGCNYLLIAPGDVGMEYLKGITDDQTMQKGKTQN